MQYIFYPTNIMIGFILISYKQIRTKNIITYSLQTSISYKMKNLQQ